MCCPHTSLFSRTIYPSAKAQKGSICSQVLMTSSILSYIQSHHVATFQMLLPPERLVSDRSPVTDKQQYKYIMWSNWIFPHYYCLHFWAHSMHDRIKPYTITFFPPSLCCGIVYIISHHRECSSSIFKAQWGYKGNHKSYVSLCVRAARFYELLFCSVYTFIRMLHTPFQGNP